MVRFPSGSLPATGPPAGIIRPAVNASGDTQQYPEHGYLRSA
jgi:hypothetical protein